MISSRQPTVWLTVAVPDMMRSFALPSHTSVPCENPDRRTRMSKPFGCVSTSIWRVKPVPNSGMPIVPVLPTIGSSSVRPSGAALQKMPMVSGSSSGISRALTPVMSSSMRIMVGSSWPSSSSLRRFASMQWYSKWVVMMSLFGSSAGCCTGQKSVTSLSCGMTTRPPGCWPVVRLTPTQPSARRFISAFGRVLPRSSRYLRT